METFVEVMEAEKLMPLFHIPVEMRQYKVEVTVRPVEPLSQVSDTKAERIRKFVEKHSYEAFISHLKQKVAEGVQFDFEAQKVIDGAETEEELEARCRSHKRTRG
jgi:hypothetical protein